METLSLPSAVVCTAQRVVDLASKQGLMIGTAESCTGGLVCACLTKIPGASAVVAGGVASYACSVKEKLLSVDPETLKRFGAVSIECAREMAKGARSALGCDIAVSITGLAGPGGGSPEKPVGTVCFALATASHDTVHREFFTGDRDAIRTQSVHHALDMFLAFLETK